MMRLYVGLSISSNFQSMPVFVGPLTRIGPVISFPVKSASMRLPLLAGLGSPSTQS